MTWEMMPTDQKHALEMQTKMYEYPSHITVIQEILANANDAFMQSEIKNKIINISLKKDKKNGYLIFHNNADPISEDFFRKKYHTMFKSSKEIGSGIGFVGIGAKIFLSSSDVGEIITITGDKKILAGKWRWMDKGAQYVTSLQTDMSKIVDLKKFPHTKGTTFICTISLDLLKIYAKDLVDIIKFWWNYTLITKSIEIRINNEPVLPYIPLGNNKFIRSFKVNQQFVKCIFWISDEELDEDTQNIIYVVHGKRIENEKLDTEIKIKDGLGKHIFCYVETPILARFVTTSKEHFEKNREVRKIKIRIKEEFWKFIEEQGFLITTKEDFKPTKELEELSSKLNYLLQKKEFRDLNPFLEKRKNPIPTPSSTGDIKIDEIEGGGSTDGKSNGNGGPKGPGDDDDVSHGLNDEGGKTGELKLRNSRSFEIIEINYDHESKESFIDTDNRCLVINTGHDFYKSIKDQKIKSFHKKRIVVEALVRYQAEVDKWSVENALDKSKDLFHSLWN